MEPIRVSAAEFREDPLRYQDIARRRPVAVTEDGQERTVLISVEEYARLKRRDREVLGLSDFTDADIAALEASRPSETPTTSDGHADLNPPWPSST